MHHRRMLENEETKTLARIFILQIIANLFDDEGQRCTTVVDREGHTHQSTIGLLHG